MRRALVVILVSCTPSVAPQPRIDVDVDAPPSRALRKLARPILNKLGEWIAEPSRGAPQRTPLGKALFYIANRWTALTRFLEDGALELDNGAVERAVRGIAIGRRNWLFAGSDAGAERAAVIYTIIESAVLHGHEPWAYLSDVLAKLAAGWPQRRLDELLPDRWTPASATASP